MPDPDPALRKRRAEAAIPAAALRRFFDRGARHERAGFRLRRVLDANDRQGAGWPVHPERDEDVRLHRARERSVPRLCSDQPRRWLRDALRVPDREGDAGFHGRAGDLEDGIADLAHERALPGQLRAKGGTDARCARRGHGDLQPLDAVRAQLHPREHRRNDAPSARAFARVCPPTQAIRPADRKLSGDLAHARGHAATGRHGPSVALPPGLVARPTEARDARVGPDQALPERILRPFEPRRAPDPRRLRIHVRVRSPARRSRCDREPPLFRDLGDPVQHRRADDGSMRPMLLHERLTAANARDPGAPAVIDGERSLSYGELESRSNELAHLLAANGISHGDRVGLYLEKSLESLVGVYGILKSGALYVPLDPGAPAARLGYIAADAGVRCLVSSSAKAAAWEELR